MAVVADLTRCEDLLEDLLKPGFPDPIHNLKPPPPPPPKDVLEEGGQGSGTQKAVYQKWPGKIFPRVYFFFPAMVTLVWGWGGGGVRGGTPGGSLCYCTCAQEAISTPPPPSSDGVRPF